MNDKLSLINSLKITEYEADGECLYYANVANTPDNVALLKQIGVPDEEILDMTGTDGEAIDISGFAWRYTPAKWYQGDLGFVEFAPEESP
ncbi:hypothetical protein D3C76_126310 [compost metagenome]